MAFETKALLRLLASQVARAESLEEAYLIIAKAANVEGMQVPTYEEERAEIEQLISKHREKSKEKNG